MSIVRTTSSGSREQLARQARAVHCDSNDLQLKSEEKAQCGCHDSSSLATIQTSWRSFANSLTHRTHDSGMWMNRLQFRAKVFQPHVEY